MDPNEWSVGEPGKMTGTKPTLEADKAYPRSSWTEMGLTNKT